MSFRPQIRDVGPGPDERNSLGSVKRTYGDNRFIAPVFNRIPSAPANRFTQIGITNQNVLNCADPNWPRQASVGSQSREVGFHADVRQQAQRNEYQKGANTWGFAPGTPLIVSNHQ